MGAVTTEQAKIHTIGGGSLLKSPERRGRIGMELDARFRSDQFRHRSFRVGEVSEKATVCAGGCLDPFHHNGRW